MAEEKKNNVKVSVMNEPQSVNPRGSEILKEAAKADHQVVEAAPSIEPKQHGWIVSTNDHPEDVKYGEHMIHVSPRAVMHINDLSLLPSQLPAGLKLKKA